MSEKEREKPIVEEKAEIQDTRVDVEREDENPGLSYEIVIGSGPD